MRRSVTISLPATLGERLDEYCARNSLSRSEVAKEALRRYFAQVEFEQLRNRLLPGAEAQGIHTDEDVFERVL
jgi:metal-responsive CopG/Arc/MetJ family transcriptional regulator